MPDLPTGPATTQWDITTCTTQGTSYTPSSTALSASLPSPTQSTASTTTMLNGESSHGDLNGTGSGELYTQDNNRCMMFAYNMCVVSMLLYVHYGATETVCLT